MSKHEPGDKLSPSGVPIKTVYRPEDAALSYDSDLADPGKWPKLQRFDYLVRTRAVSASEAADFAEWQKAQGPGYVAPHRVAAVAALRSLTGRDAEPTAKAWRAVLPREVLVFPVGGIRPDNMAQYWAVGADGFGTGSNLYTPGTPTDKVRTGAASYASAFAALKAR